MVTSKEKTEKRNKSRRNLKRRKEKASPVKNKIPRPTKGQLPDPTYSRMKFASCTDRADSDGGERVKKKPPLERPRAIL